MIDELDRVVLTTDVPEHGLSAGAFSGSGWMRSIVVAGHVIPSSHAPANVYHTIPSRAASACSSVASNRIPACTNSVWSASTDNAVYNRPSTRRIVVGIAR
jgi:hypothetical protein